MNECTFAAVPNNGQATTLRHRTTRKQVMEILVTTLRGILLIECTGGRFGKPWQALFQILLAQITDHMPVLVGQLKALIGRQSRGSRPVPALVAKLCLTNAGILTGCLGVLSISFILSHYAILSE
jgi:hypothetical protein